MVCSGARVSKVEAREGGSASGQISLFILPRESKIEGFLTSIFFLCGNLQ